MRITEIPLMDLFLRAHFHYYRTTAAMILDDSQLSRQLCKPFSIRAYGSRRWTI